VDLHRRITLAAVLGLHIALAVVLLRASRTTRIENDRGIAATLILLPSVRLQQSVAAPWSGPRVRALLLQVEPIEIESGSITLPRDIAPSIDWMGEARKVAAQSAPLRVVTRELAETQQMGIFPAPAHVAGEQYRDAEGESIVWLTSNCYMISPAPELGGPNALAHAAMPRTICPGGSETANGDLFKVLNPRR
jgi:hypothetical protein